MKLLFIFIFSLCISYYSNAQSSGITPAQQKIITAEIEIESTALKQKLNKSNIDPVLIEFTIDTFRIERYCSKCLKLDYTDYGMRSIAYETADKYDTLLNKYYQKLLRVIKGDDKKILIQAQKSWLAFRDSEMKLTETISKDEYSGGGTMQRLIDASQYMEMIKERTIKIFHHFTRASQIY